MDLIHCSASKTSRLIVDCDLDQLKLVRDFVETEKLSDSVDGAMAQRSHLVDMEFDDDDEDSDRRIQGWWISFFHDDPPKLPQQPLSVVLDQL